MDTALIIEDDPDQAELAAQLVRLRRYQPASAAAGEPGLQMARRLHPELILLDLMLPDVDGFEVCRRLRGEARTMAIPIVMVTALDSDDHRAHGFRVGANAYVTKPYEPETLFKAIDVARAWKEDLRSNRMRGEVHLELNSATAFLLEVNEFLTSLYTATPLSADQVMQLRQAVMEMGQNAIEWGNRRRPEELVEITFRIYDDRVEIVVLDQGPGFDRVRMSHAADPADPFRHLEVREELGLREGGFGILISRGMVDELRYNERGNEVTLVKRFAPAPASPA